MDNTLKSGDIVIIKEYNLTGQVIEVLNNNRYRIERKNLSVVVSGNDLEIVGEAKMLIQPMHRKEMSVLDDYYHVDLHGYSKFDAVNEVRYIIENAPLHKYTKVMITHGKGKGVLRMAVHELLRQYKLENKVKAYEFAQDNRGGYGVTIVYL